MIKSDINKFGKPLYILYPGDYHATSENCLLGTVVGSCVVICLYDKSRGIAGMGHFIVPGAMGTHGIIRDEIARNGVLSIEYLMGEIVKLGGDRRLLKAKIFGAGYLGLGEVDAIELSNSNIQFIHEYFTIEKMHVERSDLGGDFRRRIYFSVKDGVVYRQILKNNEESSEFIKLEQEYIDIQFRNKKKSGRIVIFE
jgi:chemotaxis protein CheD